jgi:rod shape-determining protein MreD
MLNRIVLPFIIMLFLISVQFIVIPFISIYNVVPNVVLIFLLFYTIRFGQISGMLFAFVVGIFFDFFSGGLIGSSAFAFTASVFIAGYFYKEDFRDVIYNVKMFVTLVFVTATLFFILYSVLGVPSGEVDVLSGVLWYSLYSGIYTTLFALVVYVIPKEKL